KKAKTYNTGDSPVVTDLSTNPAVSSLSRGERTGSRVVYCLWSYVVASSRRSGLSLVLLCKLLLVSCGWPAGHRTVEETSSVDRRNLRRSQTIAITFVVHLDQRHTNYAVAE
ncbi:uncharacterized protein THITE_39051, partial [Thermothielavioides terrestris NRRL 8126]